MFIFRNYSVDGTCKNYNFRQTFETMILGANFFRITMFEPPFGSHNVDPTFRNHGMWDPLL